LLPPSSGLIALIASTSETSVNFYQTTRRNNPGEAIFILAAVGTSDLTTPTTVMHNHNRDFLCFNFYQQGFFTK
jgi:hypothetical protein